MRKPLASRLIGCVLALLTTAFLFQTALAQTTADRVSRSGVLKVGLEGTYPPFDYIDENGSLVGFNVDLSHEIARRLGVKAEFVQSLWVSIIERLQNDEFDVIIAQMTITEERQALVDFTDAYVVSGNVLVVREGDDRFAKLADIAGHTVGVGEGTTYEASARSVDGADVRVYDDFHAYSQALIAGEVDVIIEDQLAALYNIKEQGLPLQIASPPFTTERMGIAVKKGNQGFVAELNRILAEMIADGTYRAIHLNWFGTEPSHQVY